jgi:hypothetical protein
VRRGFTLLCSLLVAATLPRATPAQQAGSGPGQLGEEPLLFEAGQDEHGRLYLLNGQLARGQKLILTASNGFFDPGTCRAAGVSELPKAHDARLIQPNFAYLDQWTATARPLRWHIWIEKPGSILARVFLETSAKQAGSAIDISMARHRKQRVTASAARDEIQAWDLRFEAKERGETSFELDAVTIADKELGVGRLYRIELTGPGLEGARLLRARWRPAAVHGSYASSSCPQSRLWVMQTRSVRDAGSYSPITTPFGYFGTSFAADRRSTGGFNFSMWASRRGGEIPPLEQMPHLLAAGHPEAEFSGFGHEGSGVKLRGWTPMPQRPETVIQALRIENDGKYHSYYAYFWEHPEQRWRLFAMGRKWSAGRSIEHLRPGSFCEIPGPPQRQRTGDIVREVRRRGWFYGPEGKWHAMDRFVVRGKKGEPTNKCWDTTQSGEFAMATGGMRYYRFESPPAAAANPNEPLPFFLSKANTEQLFSLPAQFGKVRILSTTIESTTIEGTTIRAKIELEMLRAGSAASATLYYGPRDCLSFAPRELHATERKSKVSRATQASDRSWPFAQEIPKLRTGTNIIELGDLEAGKSYYFRLLVRNDEGQVWSPTAHRIDTRSLSDAPSFFVAPSGDDRSSGQREQPFATLERARDAVREWRRSANAAQAPATIWLSGGRYLRSKALELDARDSHTHWRARGRGIPQIVGGFELSVADMGHAALLKDHPALSRLDQKLLEQLRYIELPAASAAALPGRWPDSFRGYGGWPELFVNAKPMRLARWPNDGYAKIAKVLERGSRPRHNEKPDRPGAFVFAEDEPASWSSDQEIYLNGYWCFSWYDEVLRVAQLDAKAKTIRFAAPHRYGIGGPSGGKFYSLNVLETLDQQGEFVFDRKRNRLYALLPTQAPLGRSDRDYACVSVLGEELIRIDKAKSILFEKIAFGYCRSDALRVTDSESCAFDSCTIRNVAGRGLVISGGNDCGIRRSEIENTGRGGVSLSGGDRATLTPSAHYVRDCRIHHYARLIKTYQPAVALGGVGQFVEYNDLSNAPHQAISFGGNDHRIAHNRIERVCLDTGDAGAIYCGRDWTLGGTIIEKNWFSKIGKGAHHHNWAVYPDDQASGLIVRDNVVVDCPSGFLFGGGRSNVIEGNLFVRVGKWPLLFDARGTGWGVVSEPTLKKGLAAIPSTQEPWRSRFPWLLGLAEDPKRNWPMGNRIEGNLFVDCHAPSIDKKVREGGSVRDNRTRSGAQPSYPELGSFPVGPRPNQLR